MKLEQIIKPNNNEDLYSTKQVADFMKLTYTQVYRLIKHGKIRVINVALTGKKPIWRIKAEDVQTYYNNLAEGQITRENSTTREGNTETNSQLPS